MKKIVYLFITLLCFQSNLTFVCAENTNIIKLKPSTTYTANLHREATVFPLTIKEGEKKVEQLFEFPEQGIVRIEFSTEQKEQAILAQFYGTSNQQVQIKEQEKAEIAILQSGNGTLCVQVENPASQPIELQVKVAFYSGKDRTIASKKWNVSGATSKTDAIDYKINIPKNGYIMVEEEPYYIEDQIQVSLNKDKKKSKDRKEVLLSEKNNWTSYYAVKKGTYYLKVSGSDRPYLFSYTFFEATDESGSSKAKATTLQAGRLKKGLIWETDKKANADWFKVVLSKKQKLRLTIDSRANAPLSYQIVPASSNIKLHNNKFYPSNGISKVTTASLPKGTYYIRVTKKSEQNTSGFYSLKLEK